METVSEVQGISRSLSSAKSAGEDVGSADLPVEFDHLTELDMWVAPIYWGQLMLKEIQRLKMQLENVQFVIDSTGNMKRESEFNRGWSGALNMIEGAINAKRKLKKSETS